MSEILNPSTAKPTQAQRARNQSLGYWHANELADLFATLQSAPALMGNWYGRLFSITGFDRLPRPIAAALYTLLATPLNPWRGKSFNGTQGSNQWLRVKGLSFGSYQLSEQPGPDGKMSLWLNYDCESNPRLLRSIRGEARHLQDGQLLCRMLWHTKDQYSTLLWFTLSGDIRHGS